jgi:hypothetical protein
VFRYLLSPAAHPNLSETPQNVASRKGGTKLHGHKYVCTLAETQIGRLVYVSGWSGGTVVTITLLFTFMMILLTVRLPTHLEHTKSICAIICLYVKICIMLETVREANKINNFRGEHGVYNVGLFMRSILAQRFPRIAIVQWYNV